MPNIELTHLNIATRQSPLALWQAEHIKARLETLYPNLKVELVTMVTRGDKILDTPLAKIGGKGLFVKELEQALYEGRADIAVHSLKDVPTQLAKGLTLAAVPERGNSRDILVYKNEIPTDEKIRIIATSSLRRKAQWQHQFPNHKFENLRGNINTRVRKLVENDKWSGAIFAAAGVERIGLAVPAK